MGVVDPEYGRTAMKFSERFRYAIYVDMCVYGVRMKQIFETAPVVGLLTHLSSSMRATEEYRQNVRAMILNGMKPGDILRKLDLPLALLRLKPMAACRYIMLDNPRIFQMDDLSPLFPVRTDPSAVQVRKVMALNHASGILGNTVMASPERDRVRNIKKMCVMCSNIIRSFATRKKVDRVLFINGIQYDLDAYTTHLVDWAFNYNMFSQVNQNVSVPTLSGMIAEHDRRGWFGDRELEEPENEYKDFWFEDCKIVHKGADYLIKAIQSKSELQAEGCAMHHCVASYHNHIVRKQCQIYSITDSKGKRLATADIRPTVESGKIIGYKVNQLRGPCNAALADKTLHHKIVGFFEVSKELE
jgi:hypothetical protein